MTQNRLHVLAALAYCKMGMNALPLADPIKNKTKHPSVPWKNKSKGGIKGYSYQDYTVERWTAADITAHSNWYNHGVVGITGIRGDHNIDLDKIKDFTIIDEVLALLGLPSNYPWVVLSGSHVGAQIWIHNDESSGELTKDFYDYSARDASRFDHVELRWRGNCCVLPLSKHPSGNSYQFREDTIPTGPPATVPLALIIKALNTIGIIRNPDKRAWSATPTHTDDEYEAVKARLTIISDDEDGAEIECPWAGEHTDGRPNAHIWPNEGDPGFSCLHAHCKERRWGDVLGLLGLEGDKDLPAVIIAGQMRDYIAAAVEALRTKEEAAPTLFVQSGRLVRVGRDEQQRPVILHVGVAELRNSLTHAANFFRLKAHGDEFVRVETAPPKDLAEQILALAPDAWPFPALEAVIETPVIRPDFSLLDTPGYDAATRLYYVPQMGMGDCKVPASPSRGDVQQALRTIDDSIGEFCYMADADRANAYAAFITPLVRPAIKRHIPIALVDAPKQGSGKGLFVDACATVATGSPASNLSAPSDEAEWDKRITSLLLEGRSFICIDNISGTLQSASLDSVLTSDYKEGRVLGVSKMVRVANRAAWVATGNNIKIGGDLARRSYRIRLDPRHSRPWMRTGFKHEDLQTWVQLQRSRLIVAVLTLARAWHLAGHPLDKSVPSLGTFSDWATTLGGILKHAGVEGFLSNLEELYEEADEDSTQWEAFLQAWHEIFADKETTVAEIVKMFADSADSADSVKLAGALPDALQFPLKDKPNSFSIRLGKALEKRVDARYGPSNLYLKKRQDKHTKAKTWQVFADSADSATTHAQSEKESSKEYTQCIPEDDTEHYPHYPQSTPHFMSGNGFTSGLNGNSKVADSSITPPAENRPPLSSDELARRKEVVRNYGMAHDWPRLVIQPDNYVLAAGQPNWERFLNSQSLYLQHQLVYRQIEQYNAVYPQRGKK